MNELIEKGGWIYKDFSISITKGFYKRVQLPKPTKKVIGVWHTHPHQNYPIPSLQDIKVLTSNKNIKVSIIRGNNEDIILSSLSSYPSSNITIGRKKFIKWWKNNRIQKIEKLFNIKITKRSFKKCFKK